MLALCYNISTNSNRTFSRGLRAGQCCIILTVNFFADAKADSQRTFTGGFRIFPDGHGNSLLGIVGLCILAQGDRIFIHCLTTQAR